MQLTTVTWNIGGGKLLNPNSDPNLLASYTRDGLDEVIKILKKYDPDIITLQECEGDHSSSQIAKIANALSLKHYKYDPISRSHINKTQMLGNGIISRYPIKESCTARFINPNIEFNLEGTLVKSHDKGYIQCLIDINGLRLYATSLHLLPFRKVGFDLKSEISLKILKNLEEALNIQQDLVLIQGDFNIDTSTIEQYMVNLFDRTGMSEIVLSEPTTPKLRMYDHVLYKGLKLKDLRIHNSVQTDHYPVITTFELDNSVPINPK